LDWNCDYDRDDISIVCGQRLDGGVFIPQQGNGTFEEVAAVRMPWILMGEPTQHGVDFADYDNDGWPDIVVTDLANQRYALYRNNGDGSFTYASTTRESAG